MFGVHQGADRAARAVCADHQVGLERIAPGCVDGDTAVRAARLHGGYLGSASQAHPGKPDGVLLQPSLQQVPRGAVTVDAVQHWGIGGDAGDFAKQGNVYPEPAAAVGGWRRAALGHGHLDRPAGQGHCRGQADQTAADHHAPHRAALRRAHQNSGPELPVSIPSRAAR
jgi:hypothetical protein